jgi:hypothetical protein
MPGRIATSEFVGIEQLLQAVPGRWSPTSDSLFLSPDAWTYFTATPYG